jgi:hypothetical protein
MNMLHSFINNHLPTAKVDESFSNSIIRYSSDNKVYIIGLGNINGVITEEKKTEIIKQLSNSDNEVYFFTLFDCKETFQKNIDLISWGSYVWLETDPEHTIHFDNKPKIKPNCTTKVR